ncbi:cytochrome c-type biogenesis CcmF C-terminal domain-containing protein, partial [Gemmatimonadota bacterium]
DEKFFSREMQLAIGAIVIIGITILVGLGTSAPVISRLSGGEGAAIDVSFYGRTTLPLGILMALGIGISVLLRWRGGDSVRRNALIVSLVAALIGSGVAALLGVDGLLLVLFAGSSVLALAANLFILQHTLSNDGWKLAGGPLSHIGAALMLIAIVGATTGKKQTADLIYETPTEVLGYELTFTGWSPEPGGKQSTSVTFTRPGSADSSVLKPKLYQQYGSGRMMVRAEPHISRGLLSDIYLAPAQYLPPSEAISGSGNILDLGKGESQEIDGATITFEDYDMGGNEPSDMTAGTIGARVRVDFEGGSEVIVPRWSVGGEQTSAVDLPYGVEGQLRLQGIDADRGRVTLMHLGSDVPVDGRAVGGLLTVELSEKPLMSILWIGVLLVLVGGTIAIIRRAIVLRSKES